MRELRVMVAEITLQDKFLSALKAQNIGIAVYLLNGVKLRGQIDEFDHEVLVLKGSTRQVIYKHAISTVIPFYSI